MIGIIVAMEVEKDSILEVLDQYTNTMYYNRCFYTGTIADKEVVVMKGGVGKTAAGIATAQMIEHYHPDCILNIGCAGGLKEEESILDVVISKRLTYHDWDTTAIGDSAASFDCGQYCFYSDEPLVEKAKKLFESLGVRVFCGDIVSGDLFVSKGPNVERIIKQFPSAIACEMEATSIAHACSDYGVPFICIRTLSDVAVKEGNGMDFNVFVKKACENAAKFCKLFVDSI